MAQLESNLAQLGLDPETEAKLIAQAKETLAKDKEQYNTLKNKLTEQGNTVKRRILTGAKHLNELEISEAQTALDKQQEADRLTEVHTLMESLRENQMVCIVNLLLMVGVRVVMGTKRIQPARGWCATVGGTLQIVSVYPASPEARPAIFGGKPAVRPRSMGGGAPTACGRH